MVVSRKMMNDQFAIANGCLAPELWVQTGTAPFQFVDRLDFSRLIVLTMYLDGVFALLNLL